MESRSDNLSWGSTGVEDEDEDEEAVRCLEALDFRVDGVETELEEDEDEVLTVEVEDDDVLEDGDCVFEEDFGVEGDEGDESK